MWKPSAYVGAGALLATAVFGCSAGWSADHGDIFPYATDAANQDARDLALLAPPSRRSTATVSYGDAPFARAHVAKGRARPFGGPGSEAPVGIYFCRNRAAPRGEGVCLKDPRSVGYRQFYRYTPSYATAPQVGRGAINNDSVLPPASAFFYSANSLLFGSPNNY